GVTERPTQLVSVGLDGGKAVLRALRARHMECHVNGERAVERFPCPEPCARPCGECVGHCFAPRLQVPVRFEHDPGASHGLAALRDGGAGDEDGEGAHSYASSAARRLVCALRALSSMSSARRRWARASASALSARALALMRSILEWRDERQFQSRSASASRALRW